MGSSSTPLESTNGFPPGHLPSENTDPHLVSFASIGTGRLKGNISAASLAATPIPPSMAGTDGYTAANSWLDLLISGYVYIVAPAILRTQPDQSDPDAPVLGAGPSYLFVAGTGKVVTSARDKNGTPVNLNAALNAAAYSAYFTFTTDRVIVPSPPAALLTITHSGNDIMVSWPPSVTGWTLQTSDNLSTGTWVNYGGPVSNNTVTNSPRKGNLFWRLTHP